MTRSITFFATKMEAIYPIIALTAAVFLVLGAMSKPLRTGIVTAPMLSVAAGVIASTVLGTHQAIAAQWKFVLCQPLLKRDPRECMSGNGPRFGFVSGCENNSGKQIENLNMGGLLIGVTFGW